MKALAPLLLAAGFALSSLAAPAPWRQRLSDATRRSEQFLVVDVRMGQVAPPLPRAAANLVQLEPDMLLISAERIRERVYAELGLPPVAGDRIHLALLPNSRLPGMNLITTSHPGSWQYDLQVPEQVDRFLLIRSITHVVLLELANRGQGPKSAELPLWLIEGVASLAYERGGPDLIMNSVAMGNYASIIRERRGADALQSARALLRDQPALTFAELSRPEPLMLAPENLPIYQASARILVHEMLQAPGGRERMMQMLRELPNFWNWESAFLKAFSDRFARMLDVEKWWSVNLTALTGNDPSKIWSQSAALEKLDEILSSTSLAIASTNALPVRSAGSLQEIVAEWEFSRQRPFLQQKVTQLTLLRVNTPRPLNGLVEAYRDLLHTYLQKRAAAGYAPPTRREVPVNARLLLADTLRHLTRLDEQRALARQAVTEQAQAPSPASAPPEL